MRLQKSWIKAFTIGILLNCCSPVVWAQQFAWQVTLQKVPEDGFYQVPLTPELMAKVQRPDFADIRIFEQNIETGYLLTTKASDYFAIPDPQLKITDPKDKSTVIQVSFNQAYVIDQLFLQIGGPIFYKRNSHLAVFRSYSGKENRNYENLLDFTISSGKETRIQISPHEKYRQLFIIIENEDNPPLTVKKVSAFQQKRYLTAALKKDKTYLVKLGQENILPPKYDLENFRDSIPSPLPELGLQNLTALKPDVPQKPTLFSTNSWIWLALIFLTGILGTISYKLVNEMRKNKTEQPPEQKS